MHKAAAPRFDGGGAGEVPASLRGALAALARDFRSAGLTTPDLDARLLALEACRATREDYVLNPERPLAAEEAGRLAQYRARRLAREPVSRILGTRDFWGRRFRVTPAVLDPRPETETLIEAVLELANAEGLTRAPLKILDLGTGSGAILLTLLAELPSAWGVGADIGEDALAVARDNARRLGVAGRACFARADWAEPFGGSFDLIVSNPPYISSGEIAGLDREVRDYDPPAALDGGAGGLDAYRRIAETALPLLAANGSIFLEAGDGQADAIIRIFAERLGPPGLAGARVRRDLAGINRVVAIKRQMPSR
jgi:release factor glutamine methyltransferase